MMTVQLVSDIYTLIYQYLDLPTQTMMALSCKKFLRLGIFPYLRGVALCSEVAKYGYLDQLKWLRAHKFPWNADVCTGATRYNCFGVLRWSYENGCLLDGDTSDVTGLTGNLDILKWLRNHHCPWGEFLGDWAFEMKHYHIIRFALRNGYSWQYTKYKERRLPRRIVELRL